MAVDSSGAVLVHGGMCTSCCWDPVMEHLTIPATAVDLPGRGQRPADLFSVTLDDCVSAVVGAADQQGWDRFTLVGHSLGGVTITETAWRHPDRVARLIYVGALIPAPGQSGCMLAYGVDWPVDQLVTIDEGIARTMFGNDLSDGEWRTWWPRFVPEAPGLINAHLSGYPSGIPTTYIALADDVAVPPALWDQMIGRIGADTVTRKQISAGHMAMYSKPKELADLISERFAADEPAQVTALGASETFTNRTSGRAGTASARNQRNARFPLG